jgi:hypothetical protein
MDAQIANKYMKIKVKMAVALFLALTFLPALAQTAGKGGGGMGGMAPNAPQFSATFAKLFGEHKAFTATIKNDITQISGNETITMPCKLAFLDGKSRLEIDLTQSKGSQIPPGMTAQLKAMGMGEMTVISVPAKDSVILIYPGLQSYAEVASPNGKGGNDESKIKLSASELGKEAVEGHPCVKNKVLITDAQGKTSQATVWNASDLKKFPVRIDTADENAKIKMVFSDVKFDKPDARLFAPPANFTRYTSIETMMQQALMKRMQGMGGTAPR